MRNVLLAEPALLPLVGLGLLVLMLAIGFIVGAIFLVATLIKKSSGAAPVSPPAGKVISPRSNFPKMILMGLLLAGIAIAACIAIALGSAGGQRDVLTSVEFNRIVDSHLIVQATESCEPSSPLSRVTGTYRKVDQFGKENIAHFTTKVMLTEGRRQALLAVSRFSFGTSNTAIVSVAKVGVLFLFVLLLAFAGGLIIFLVIRLVSKNNKSATTSSVPPIAPSTQAVRQCPKCGTLLKSDVPEGLCPACLLQHGIATEGGVPPGTPPFTPPPLGELAKLFPQLEILEVIGQGGMGAVYKARQPALDRFVALKILAPRSGGDLDFAGRFSREARALAKLSHPNIVAVYDFGQVANQPAVSAHSTPDPRPLHYFIMEYVDGPNLRQVEKAGKLAPREALQIIPQICAALQFAHDEGIVHRDIKPENVLLDKKGRVKIADFGLAKILGQEADFRLTGARDVMGTPHYMAPEQVEKPQEVDHRADIYSLGVVFYEMLTGELPLGKFDPPSHKVQIDVRLDDVVLRSLANNPDRRYQHVSEVKTELESIAGTPANIKPGATRALRKERILVASLVVCVVLLVGAGIFLANRVAINRQWAADTSANLDAINGVKAFINIRRFSVAPPNVPTINYAATLPYGYALRVTASPGITASSLPAPSGSDEYYVSWNLPLTHPVYALSPEHFKPGQMLPAQSPPYMDSPEQREAQRKTIEAQLQELQNQGSILMVAGQQKLIFAVTNGSGDIWKGFLELVRADVNSPEQRFQTFPDRTLRLPQAATNGTLSPEEQVILIENQRAQDRGAVPSALPPPPLTPATIDPRTGLPLAGSLAAPAAAIPPQTTPSSTAVNPQTGLTPSTAASEDAMLLEQPPVVVETFPVSGARDVPAGEIEIRVRFSKAMKNGSWSWSTAWKNSTPEKGDSPRYVDDGRTCVMKVQLEPGHTYAWWLNSAKFTNFRDRAGLPAVPYLLIFQTKPN